MNTVTSTTPDTTRLTTAMMNWVLNCVYMEEASSAFARSVVLAIWPLMVYWEVW